MFVAMKTGSSMTDARSRRCSAPLKVHIVRYDGHQPKKMRGAPTSAMIPLEN
jgi:hypothetical protein